MVQILQAFSRIVIALIAGSMIIFGAIYLADILAAPTEDALAAAGNMIRENPTRTMVLALAGISAYAIGTVVVSASNLVFTRIVRIQADDLYVVSQIESLKKPQLLNETLDLLNVRRTLVSFTFPLLWLGFWMMMDPKPWTGRKIPLAAGLSLMIMGFVAPFMGWLLSHRIDATLKALMVEAPEGSDSVPSESG
jgi:hypothetical protein